MTDRSKFEQMLEYLISDEQDKAKELFHQLVVEKSREIYEDILSEDFNEAKEEEEEEDDEEEMEEAVHVHVHGQGQDDDEEMEDDGMGMPGDEHMSVADEGDDEFGGDPADDMLGDLEAGDDDEMDGDDMGDGEMGGEGDMEDRVMDLEDALDDLKAEFEKMMGDEEGEEGHDDMGADDEAGDEEPADEEPADDEEDELKDSFSVSDNFMREYIEKVTNPKHGDNGVNNKSTIDNMKNDMGGTVANIARGGEMGGKGVQSGLLKPNTKEENFGNINVPGGNAGKTAFKKREPGHGAEKKSSGDNGDKSTKSPINGLTRRAK